MRITIAGSIILMLLSVYGTVLISLALFILVPIVTFISVKDVLNQLFRKNLDLNKPKIEVCKLYLWIISILVSIGIQVYKDYDARKLANNFIERIEEYNLVVGKYPENLNNIGINSITKNGRQEYSPFGTFGYFIGDNKPMLIYSLRMDVYNYDFDKKEWQVGNYD